MNLNQLVLNISKCPEEYTGSKQIEMPDVGGSIGRAPGCTLSLVDHNRFISGTHCLITVYGDTYYISDVSTNGTMVNGDKILKNQPISIYDGDSLSMGQYEIHIVMDRIAATKDIASDIAPERDSVDPLVNLDEVVTLSEHEEGSIEELFMETQDEDVDSDDPVAHLNFAMQCEDDFLIRDEKIPDPVQHEVAKNNRQIADDSFSIHSEFDLPNLIPEDWMSEAQSSQDIVAKEKEDPELVVSHDSEISEKAEIAAEPISVTTEAITPKHESKKTTEHKWEEVTQPFIPSTQTSLSPKPESTEAQGGGSDSIEPSQRSQPDDAITAFYHGLGITAQTLISDDVTLFKQMGTCLRLCIDNLQKSLREVESLKGEQGLGDVDSNLIELMLSLNNQNLLAPNELVEQMLDELDDHQIAFNKALNELLLEQSSVNDPFTFANDMSTNSLFVTKAKLWGEYLEFYASNRRQLNETSLKGLIKKNYSKAIKGSHA